jgi:hypothetical protein
MSELKVGDKIRILEDGLDLATVYEGDVLEVEILEVVSHGDEEVLIFCADSWWFDAEHEGTGWEKVEGEQ